MTQLQHAGLIRADLPVSTITFLMGALKIGIINTFDLTSQERMPSIECLAEWLETINEIEKHER